MGSCLSRNKAVAPNKVLPKFDEEKDFLGERGYSKTLKSGEGVDLFAYFWPAGPDVPLKGIVQLAHGCAGYTCFDYLKFKGTGLPNVYEGSWVEAFNKAGFSVCGIDHQGYGRSKGARLSTKFQAHVDNLLLLSDEVAESGGAAFARGLPYFLVGLGMGGLAATLACLKQPDRFAGVVLLSPLLSPESLAAAKKGGSVRLGLKARPKSDDGDGSSTSESPVPWLVEAWAADPHVHDGGQLSSRQADALRPAVDQVAAEGSLEPLVLPLLVFQSERDTVSDPGGARRLQESAKSTDKTLRLLSQPWHVLTKEEGWEALLEETTAWLAARATNSGALTKGLDDGSGATAAEGAALSGRSSSSSSSSSRSSSCKGGEEEKEKEKGEEARGDRGKATAEKKSGGEDGSSNGGQEPAAASAAAAAAAVAGEAESAAAEGEKAERSSAPVLARTMSMLGRMPEREPLASGGPAADAPPVLARRYSFSGQLPRAMTGDTTPIASSGSVLGPLPPLLPVGQRRTLGSLPPELAVYNVRGKLPPLPPLLPLLDRKPIG